MSLYKQSPTGPWWVNITLPNEERVRRTTGTTDKVEAQRFHDELKAALWKQAPKLKGRTWGQAVMLWVKAEPRSESELLSLAKFGRHFPDRRITDVSREAVHQALAFCLTAGTYTRYRTMIKAILNMAKEEGWLREVPKLAERKDKKVKPRKWITPEQWVALYAELPAHMRPMAELAVETGLRQANVLGLTWDRVDLDRKVVWVEAEDTKGNAAISIPLSEGALRVLHAQEGIHPEFVFTYRGKPIKEIKTAFQAACIRAALGRTEKVEGAFRYTGFTWHGLRHTWATWHVQNGTPLDVLQKLGGWSDMRMVMHYAHHTPGYLAQFANNGKKR